MAKGVHSKEGARKRLQSQVIPPEESTALEVDGAMTKQNRATSQFENGKNAVAGGKPNQRRHKRQQTMVMGVEHLHGQAMLDFGLEHVPMKQNFQLVTQDKLEKTQDEVDPKPAKPVIEEKKEMKKVQFEISMTSNTEMTEKSETLDQTPAKKDTSSEPEGSDIEIDD